MPASPALSPDRHAPDDAPPPGSAPGLANSLAVTRHLRVDGWTAERRAGFLATLAETGVVAAACRATGMSAAAAYALRARDRRFADGWDAAGLIARARLADDLADRAINGCVEQIWRDGCIVAERHRHDNRLSMAVLARLDARCDRADRGSGAAQRLVARWDEFLTATATGQDAAAHALAAPPPPRPPLYSGPIFTPGGMSSTLRRQLVQSGYPLALDHEDADDEDVDDEDVDDEGVDNEGGPPRRGARARRTARRTPRGAPPAR